MISNLGDRRTYLGASEVAQALGLSTHGTARELWAYKTGAAPPQRHKKIFDRGHDMEDVIVSLLERDHGMTIVGRQAEFCDIAGGRPWLKAHVDGVAPEYTPLPGREPLQATGMGLVEMKAPGSHQVDKWRDIGMDNDHVIQTQMQLWIANQHSGGQFGWARFAFLDYDNYQLPAYDLPFDKDFVASLIPYVDRFWKCVQDGTPPPEEPAKIMPIPEVDGTLHVPEEGSELHDVLMMACEHYIAKAGAEAAYKQAAEIAKKVMGDFSKCKVPDFCTVSYYWMKGRETVSADKLNDWTAELVDHVLCGQTEKAFKMATAWDRGMFTKTSEPVRVFKITPTGEGKELLNQAKEGKL